jgi:hypothetical protein
MLNPSEKAYFLALEALKRKDYPAAAEHFNKAAPHFENNAEFNLLRETTQVLLTVKTELTEFEGVEEVVEVEEVFSNGQETDIR